MCDSHSPQDLKSEVTFPRRSRAERLALVWFCYMAGLAAASQLSQISQISVHPQLPKLFYESLEAAAILGHDRPADSVGSVAIEPHLGSLHFIFFMPKI